MSLPLISMKHYAERGVQTDGILIESSPSLSTISASVPSSCSLDILDSFSGAILSSPTHSRSSTQFDSAYSHPDDDCESDGSSSVINTARTYKRHQLPHSRPSNIPSHKVVSSRMVSLPETTPRFSAKAILEKTGMRVVSMPVRTLGESSFSSDNTDIQAGTPFISDGEEHSRVRVESRATDIPHTPSPPSSPESILIIANKNQLSEDFLRNNVRIEVPSMTHPDNEGWITWAKSPPRPIPALHGPLSLPYARCPSGAEGTIIEEQDNLSRMIWGLEGEDMASNRPRADSLPSATSHPTTHKAPTPVNVPPRFQKQRHEMDHIPLAQHQNSGSRGIRHSPAQPMVQASRMQLRQDVPEYSLRGSEPIDLTTLLRQRDEYPAKGNYPDYDFNTQSHSPDGRDLRIYDLANEVGLDWRTLLLEQERLGKSGLSSSRSPYVNEVRDQSQPLMVASPASSLSAAGSFRSPIILEHLAGHLPPNTGPRRLSALEIAQKYRQQQLQHHQQNFLPTPPSSSSPIWSSRFSPYQGSVFSPELLAASGLSKMSPSILHSTLPLPDPPHRLPQVSRSQLNNLGFTTRKIPSLAPPAQISDSYKYQTCATSGRTSNAMSAHLLPDNASIQTRRTSNLSSPVARSPAHPRPPPNTPLAVASSPYNLKYSDNRTQPSIMATPPSPSSPDPHSRTISHQQPRSIPLSRLIQRRLSAVPEEDYVSSTDHSLIEPQIATASAIRRLLSPTSVQQTNLRISSPANGMFVAQSKTSNFAAEDFLPLEDGSVQAMVRLPGAGSKIGYTNRNGSSGLNGRNDSVQHGGSHKDITPKRVENTRGRGQKRNGRGRKGRGAAAGNVVNGPERVDGGLMVKS